MEEIYLTGEYASIKLIDAVKTQFFFNDLRQIKVSHEGRDVKTKRIFIFTSQAQLKFPTNLELRLTDARKNYVLAQSKNKSWMVIARCGYRGSAKITNSEGIEPLHVPMYESPNGALGISKLYVLPFGKYTATFTGRTYGNPEIIDIELDETGAREIIDVERI